MKKNIEEVLVKHLGDGFAKIIFGPNGVGKTEFLFNYFKEKLNSLGHFVIDLKEATREEIFLKFSEITNDYSDSKIQFIFLIKDIYKYYNFDEIINVCTTNKNFDLICTSDIEYPQLYIDKATYIRGRIFSIFYPSTMFDEYAEYFGNNINEYLFDHNLNLEIFNNLKCLHSEETEVCRKLLTYYSTPATIRNISIKLKNRFSEYQIDNIYKNLKRKFLFYVLDRIDIKTNKVISTGKFIYPVDTRFYGYFDNNNYRKNYKKYLMAASIAKLFYDDYKVYKAVFASQRKNKCSYKNFTRNSDAGFLVIKGSFRFLVFVEPYLNDEIIKNILKTPSNLPKYIVTFDKRGGIEMDINGLYFCSAEYFLKEGIK